MCSVNGSDYCLSHTKKSLPRRNSKINQYCSDCSDKETAFSSVTQSCPILCDPVDCSMPGFPVLYHLLLELAQTHVHRVSDAIQQSPPLSSPSPLAFSLSQDQGLFQ